MSMSTGDVRRPSTTKQTKAVASDVKKPEPKGEKTGGSGAKAGDARPAAKAAARPSGKAAPARGSSTGGGGRSRKPLAPVKVSQGRNWGPITMFAGAGLFAVLIIGFAAFQLIKQSNQPTWQDRADGIEGINNYLKTNPEWFAVGPEGNHKAGVLTFPTNPAVGGTHNGRWQSCMGDVFTEQVPKEQAVHSLEHGAVWVTYRPDLPQSQIDDLAGKVRDRSFMLMSPYPGLDRPISLQAWGYQLKVDEAGDDRIDEFIGALRQNATQEPEASCTGGITDTGTAPLDLPVNEQPGG